LQIDALTAHGVKIIYRAQTSAKTTTHRELENCLKALRDRDTLVAWRLDPLGLNLTDLLHIVGSPAANAQNFAYPHIPQRALWRPFAFAETASQCIVSKGDVHDGANLKKYSNNSLRICSHDKFSNGNASTPDTSLVAVPSPTKCPQFPPLQRPRATVQSELHQFFANLRNRADSVRALTARAFYQTRYKISALVLDKVNQHLIELVEKTCRFRAAEACAWSQQIAVRFVS